MGKNPTPETAQPLRFIYVLDKVYASSAVRWFVSGCERLERFVATAQTIRHERFLTP